MARRGEECSHLKAKALQRELEVHSISQCGREVVAREVRTTRSASLKPPWARTKQPATGLGSDEAMVGRRHGLSGNDNYVSTYRHQQVGVLSAARQKETLEGAAPGAVPGAARGAVPGAA